MSLKSPSTAEIEPTPRRIWVALTLITLIGLALRWPCLAESLWLDELHTGWVVKDGWSDVAWRAQLGNQSPLWFYAVKLVTTIGGGSELTLRLLSLMAGTALIPAAFWLIRVFASSAVERVHHACDFAGLFAAALVAVDPHCIFFATEARPYACLQLFAAVQLGLFWRILQQPTTTLRLAWVGLTALAFHLHYTGILLVLGESSALLGYYLLSHKPVPYRPWRALFDWQLVVILCLPAIAHVLEVGKRREIWAEMSGRPEASELLSMFPLYPAIAVLLLACGVAGTERWRRAQNPKQPAAWTPVLLVALWFALPLLAAWSAAHFDLARMFVRRYLMAVAIGPLLLTGLLLTLIPTRWLQWTLAAAAMAYSVYDSGMVFHFRDDGLPIASRGEDWRGAIAWLRNEYQTHPHIVLLDAGLVEDRATYQGDLLHRELKYRSFALTSLYDAEIPADQIVSWSLYRNWRATNGRIEGPMDLWLVVRTHDDLFVSLGIDTQAARLRGLNCPQSANFRGVKIARLSPPPED